MALTPKTGNLFDCIGHIRIKINNHKKWLILGPTVSGTDHAHDREGGSNYCGYIYILELCITVGHDRLFVSEL